MDWVPVLSTALGGVLAIGGGYIAVVVGESARREDARDERLRVLRRAVLSDTRDYLLALLDVSLARVLDSDDDKANELAIDWPGAARRPRIDRGYVGDPVLLAEYTRVSNRLTAIYTARLAKDMAATPMTGAEVNAYTEVRARLTRAFVAMETAIESGADITVLSAEDVSAIEGANPLAAHLQFMTADDSPLGC